MENAQERTFDARHMQRAVELARRGLGCVSPNPPVGCVIARGEMILGEGWHEAYGGPHAEVHALEKAGPAAAGATVYVTLMPCAHHGKTPPCTEALIRARVGRVVAAVDDPNPESGDGGAILRRAGIPVDVGLGAHEAAYTVRGFLKHVATGLPFVCLKYAMSLDGKIATRTGDSRWISGEEARAEVQQLRTEHDAILVGAGTVRVDDPRLTVRAGAQPQPRRVIVDSQCRLSPDARIFQEGTGEIVILTTREALVEAIHPLEAAGATVIRVDTRHGRVDLAEGLRALAALGVRLVLCEGGAMLAGSLLEETLVDELVVYIAPKLLGGQDAPSAVHGTGLGSVAEAWQMHDWVWRPVGPDLCVRGRVGDWSWLPAGAGRSG